MRIKYPVRCVIVDAGGMPLSEEADIDGNAVQMVARTPDESRPHIGKHGLAELVSEFDVKITLDDGNIIHGYECWWIPEEELSDYTVIDEKTNLS